MKGFHTKSLLISVKFFNQKIEKNDTFSLKDLSQTENLGFDNWR